MEQGVKLETLLPKSDPDITRNSKGLLNMKITNRFECTSQGVLKSTLRNLTILKCFLSDRLSATLPSIVRSSSQRCIEAVAENKTTSSISMDLYH